MVPFTKSAVQDTSELTGTSIEHCEIVSHMYTIWMRTENLRGGEKRPCAAVTCHDLA